MAERNIDDLPPHGRRGFFRAGMSRLVGPLAGFIEKKLPIDLSGIRTRLRPPGAIAEADFITTCYRCGACADACPADAISLTQSEDPKQNGTPFVDPEIRACVVCDELACMKVCPSAALRLVGRLEIRMGLARMDFAACLRTQGKDCKDCVDQCPLGPVAIRVNEYGRIDVVDPTRTGEGCTGCGMCQQACPARPKAIRVVPV